MRELVSTRNEWRRVHWWSSEAARLRNEAATGRSRPPQGGLGLKWRECSGQVQRRDLVARLAHDHVALELEARGELAALLGPLVDEDPELADGLGLGHRLVGVLDGLLDLGAQVGVVHEVPDVRLPAVPLGPGREGLAVQGDEGGDE